MTANERAEAFRAVGEVGAAVEQVALENAVTVRTLVIDEVSVTVPPPPPPQKDQKKDADPPYCARFTEY